MIPLILLIASNCLVGSSLAGEPDRGQAQDSAQSIIADIKERISNLMHPEDFKTLEDIMEANSYRYIPGTKTAGIDDRIVTLIKDRLLQVSGKWMIKSKQEFNPLFEEHILKPCRIIESIYNDYGRFCEVDAFMVTFESIVAVCTDVLTGEGKQAEYYRKVQYKCLVDGYRGSPLLVGLIRPRRSI